MNRLIIFLLVFSITSLSSAQLNADELKPLEVGKIRADVLDSVLQAIAEDTALEVLPANKLDLEDKFYKEVWIGGDPEIEGGITEVALFFSPPEESKKPPFNVTLLFTEKGLVARHSLPPKRQLRGGMRMDPTERNWNIYLHGFNRTGVRVAVPKSDSAITAALVCPRDFSKKQGPSERSYNIRRDIEFSLDRVSFAARADIGAQIKSSIGKALVTGKVSVSDNLPKPVRASDFSFARYPSVDLSYQTPAASANEGGVGNQSAGVETQVVLHNSAGYVLDRSVRDRVWVETVEVSERTLEPISQGGVIYRFTGGLCALVFRETSSDTIYTRKEPPVDPQD